MVKEVKEEVIVMEGEGRREVGEGEVTHTIITEKGEKMHVAEKQPHNIGAAMKLVQGEDEGAVEEEGVDPLIIDQDIRDNNNIVVLSSDGMFIFRFVVILYIASY